MADTGIIITKNPTSEALAAGGNTWFVAHAENAQTLTWQLAIALRGKATFMNRDQDMNEETLRHAKRSLDPERFFKRYFLRGIR